MPIDDATQRLLADARDSIRSRFLTDQRAHHGGQGIHHQALISSDVEATVRFWQEVLGFPLVEIFENRDLAGSTHFFFDVGNGNCVAYFDLPGVDTGPYEEVLGGHHHLAISVSTAWWSDARDRLRSAGVPIHEASGTSMYFSGPDGERLELIADPLGSMYGHLIGSGGFDGLQSD